MQPDRKTLGLSPAGLSDPERRLEGRITSDQHIVLIEQFFAWTTNHAVSLAPRDPTAEP